jgi:hypothetical protein
MSVASNSSFPISFPSNVYEYISTPTADLTSGTNDLINIDCSSGNYLLTVEIGIATDDTTTWVNSPLSITVNNSGAPIWLTEVFLSPAGGDVGPFDTVVKFFYTALVQVPTNPSPVITVAFVPEFANETVAPTLYWNVATIKLT